MKRNVNFFIFITLSISLLLSCQQAEKKVPFTDALVLENGDTGDYKTVKPLPYKSEELLSPQVRDAYSGDSLREIRFPLGGVGSGNISINGKGALSDWEVRNEPAAGFRPDFTFIGLRVTDTGSKRGQHVRFRVLEGWIDDNLMGEGTDFFEGGGYGFGPRYSLAAGLPRFSKSTFTGRFPYAKVKLEDEAFPVTAEIEGWSPFIPGNTDDSSLPLSVLDITLHNRSDTVLEAQLSFSANNFFGKKNVLSYDDKQCRMVFHNTEKNEQMCFTVVGGEPTGGIASWPKSTWMGNGGYMQYINRFIRDGALQQQLGNKPLIGSGGTATLAVGFKLKPGERRVIRYLISWYFPHRPESGGRNWYTTKYKDAQEVTDDFQANAEKLASETRRFQTALFDSNLPGIITESLSSQLAILRSCTMFRMPDGSYWGWEGTAADWGCCEGTCLHVWHYAQSIAYLFPDLERRTREWDYRHRMTPDGHLCFRAWPDAPERPDTAYYIAAADGQFGTILRVYREWQISGDHSWLKKVWPDVKTSLEYAWKAWDVDNENPFTKEVETSKRNVPDGMMTLSQYNTLDLALVGWNTFCGSMYQVALLACEKMAIAVGDEKTASEYRRLFESARTFTDQHLFNGEYYQQQESVTASKQYKSGCISEQLVGQWWSSMMGLGHIYDRDNIRTGLASLFKYNFLESCREHLNASCVFNLNDDAGLLICSWPHGNRPDNDLLYADTYMVGYEDQVAANLIYEGFVLEGLAVMKAIRDRYNGHNRNPYSQLQAGNYYARSLANYSLLLAASGFRYSAVEQCLWIDPKIRKDDLKTFFATGGAWGTLTLTKNSGGHQLSIDVAHGELPLKKLVLFGTLVRKLDVTVKSGTKWELLL